MENTKEKSVEKQAGGKNTISKIKETITRLKKCKKITITVFAGILLVVIALLMVFNEERKITTIAESSLKDVIETSELSTVEFIYNSTVTVTDEEEKPKYHVAYEGTVKAGFDFNKITTELDEESKKVVIVIPKIKINSVNINDETLDFIFVKDKYNTETTFQEAYKASYSDLESKAKSNKTVERMAYENAVDNMKAIIMPLENELPDGYIFDFKGESDTK